LSVVDASLVVDAMVTAGPLGDAARHHLRRIDILAAPAILGAEVASALRRLVRSSELDVGRGRAALHRTRSLRVAAYPFEPFAFRCWELRHQLTIYDAWYVAVAEALGSPLVTTDRRLAETPDARCDFVVVQPR
jgi:predicted nucleic acid-binding protein